MASAARAEIAFEPSLLGQVDAYSIDGVEPGEQAIEARRMRIGGRVDFGEWVRVQANLDLVGGPVRFGDLLARFKAGDSGFALQVGQQRPNASLETMTSNTSTSFVERAQLQELFSLQRRGGAVLSFERKDWLLTAGIFGNDLRDTLPEATRLLVLRAVHAPEVAGGRLHLGANWRNRTAGDEKSLRYRLRAGTALTDIRLLDSGSIPARGENSVGLEAAGVFGRLHVAGEGQWARVDGAAQGDPQRAWAGYAEAGWLLTPGDSRRYALGAFGSTVPSRPLGKGGPGAWQLNGRVDRAVVWGDDSGGRLAQTAVSASLHWIPVRQVKLIGQVSRLTAESTPDGPRDATFSALRMQVSY